MSLIVGGAILIRQLFFDKSSKIYIADQFLIDLEHVPELGKSWAGAHPEGEAFVYNVDFYLDGTPHVVYADGDDLQVLNKQPTFIY